jgi:uncharacterized membrane protein
MEQVVSDALEKINSKKVRRVLRTLVRSAIVFVIFVFGAYFLAFHDGVSHTQEVWGQFGDFVGGTLNPILSFLSLIALVYTVLLQVRQLDIARDELRNSRSELEATRQELRRSADAQRVTATALQEQAKHAVISAKLAALSSALSVTSEALAQAQSAGLLAGPGTYQKLLQRKEAIASEILSITEQLCASSVNSQGQI